MADEQFTVEVEMPDGRWLAAPQATSDNSWWTIRQAREIAARYKSRARVLGTKGEMIEFAWDAQFAAAMPVRKPGQDPEWRG